jgi:haloalkane dehalogenase
MATKELPLDGESGDVVRLVNYYSKWFSESQIPKLSINAELDPLRAPRETRLAWPNHWEITVRAGHFIQEDSPHEV